MESRVRVYAFVLHTLAACKTCFKLQACMHFPKKCFHILEPTTPRPPHFHLLFPVFCVLASGKRYVTAQGLLDLTEECLTHTNTHTMHKHTPIVRDMSAKDTRKGKERKRKERKGKRIVRSWALFLTVL